MLSKKQTIDAEPYYNKLIIREGGRKVLTKNPKLQYTCHRHNICGKKNIDTSGTLDAY